MNSVTSEQLKDSHDLRLLTLISIALLLMELLLLELLLGLELMLLEVDEARTSDIYCTYGGTSDIYSLHHNGI